MDSKCIRKMTREEIKDYIFCIQDYFKNCIESGIEVDTILDNSTILDEFEDFLPESEYPIFVITILNGFKSETIIANILDCIERKKVIYGPN